MSPHDTELILLLGGLHLIGAIVAAVLLVIFIRSDPVAPQPANDDCDDGDGPGPGNDRSSPPTPRSPYDGGLPLPTSLPTHIRLRTPARLADLHPKPSRRPAHAPTSPRVPAR
ncbi:MAG TPA: hypothetical protein VHE14_05395 [Solirubrobacteraceae bacterium]|nr:hypothetical protein [Solirubrobacteraceae bacterium]